MADEKDSSQAEERDEAEEDLTLTDEDAEDVRGGLAGKKVHWPDVGKKK
jgi:hypothetical protein